MNEDRWREEAESYIQSIEEICALIDTMLTPDVRSRLTWLMHNLRQRSRGDLPVLEAKRKQLPANGVKFLDVLANAASHMECNPKSNPRDAKWKVHLGNARGYFDEFLRQSEAG